MTGFDWTLAYLAGFVEQPIPGDEAGDADGRKIGPSW
jgi:hypothetical protein